MERSNQGPLQDLTNRVNQAPLKKRRRVEKTPKRRVRDTYTYDKSDLVKINGDGTKSIEENDFFNRRTCIHSSNIIDIMKDIYINLKNNVGEEWTNFKRMIVDKTEMSNFEDLDFVNYIKGLDNLIVDKVNNSPHKRRIFTPTFLPGETENYRMIFDRLKSEHSIIKKDNKWVHDTTNLKLGDCVFDDAVTNQLILATNAALRLLNNPIKAPWNLVKNELQDTCFSHLTPLQLKDRVKVLIRELYVIKVGLVYQHKFIDGKMVKFTIEELDEISNNMGVKRDVTATVQTTALNPNGYRILDRAVEGWGFEAYQKIYNKLNDQDLPQDWKNFKNAFLGSNYDNITDMEFLDFKNQLDQFILDSMNKLKSNKRQIWSNIDLPDPISIFKLIFNRLQAGQFIDNVGTNWVRNSKSDDDFNQVDFALSSKLLEMVNFSRSKQFRSENGAINNRIKWDLILPLIKTGAYSGYADEIIRNLWSFLIREDLVHLVEGKYEFTKILVNTSNEAQSSVSEVDATILAQDNEVLDGVEDPEILSDEEITDSDQVEGEDFYDQEIYDDNVEHGESENQFSFRGINFKIRTTPIINKPSRKLKKPEMGALLELLNTPHEVENRKNLVETFGKSLEPPFNHLWDSFNQRVEKGTIRVDEDGKWIYFKGVVADFDFWDYADTEKLVELCETELSVYGVINFHRVADNFQNKDAKNCRDKYIAVKAKEGPISNDELESLCDILHEFKGKSNINYSDIGRLLGLRTGVFRSSGQLSKYVNNYLIPAAKELNDS
ncbi:uncharacterized protein KGF55_003525 [Candida pseudojiufengensis]|uniref:uncharacterized protein n=1 Tax=Candida pseudojiufengensis TaxID=497109 RepID=UPI002224AB4E|nr:uncharacterized protein KGF55_003525 [Candida pseudojiufengensis]KAI5962449.1 hypothetical protein KGF55_003525 [Candida pseudojiufengensis]